MAFLAATTAGVPAALARLHRRLPPHVKHLLSHLLYILLLVTLGSLLLHLLHPADRHPAGLVDLLYTSAAAVTLSGINAIELEAFSASQLLVLTFLMFAGGDVFIAILRLAWIRSLPVDDDPEEPGGSTHQRLKQRGLLLLMQILLLYLAAFHVLGLASVMLYLRVVPSAAGVLRKKGIPATLFAVFLTISSFTNVGLVPTNENMMVFVGNPGLLLLATAVILSGSVLFSVMLRAIVAALHRLTRWDELKYMLENSEELGFDLLLPAMTTVEVAASVGGFLAVQVVLFLSMEWNKGYLRELNPRQKIALGVFQAANARHCGETAVDLSKVSPAVLLLFMWAMYLPSYASFRPSRVVGEEEQSRDKEPVKGYRLWLKMANLPQIAYVLILIIIVCIIERENMSTDPFNFSFLFVAFEVVSAYGNVGFSTGYSCDRQLNRDSTCKDMWIGLSGRWSNSGKLMIIFIMIFGRMKGFHLGGGKAWRSY